MRPILGVTRRVAATARARPEVAVLLAVFVVSRVVYALLGVSMDYAWIERNYALPSVAQLQYDLVQSVWFWHSGPPLYVLGAGLIEGWSPLPAALSFHLVYLALGLVLTFALRELAARLGASRRGAVVIAAVISVSPMVVVYENFPSYDYPLAVMLAVLMAAVGRIVEQPDRLRPVVVVAAAAGAGMLLRSVLHPVWWVPVAIAIMLALRGRLPLRRVAAVLAVPLVLVLGFTARNVALFGEAGLSTWFGGNLARVSFLNFPTDTQARMQSSGELSPLFGFGPFHHREFYDGLVPDCDRRYPNVPVLQEFPEVPGRTSNFNDECMVAIHQQYREDALTAIRAEPGAYLSTAATAGQFFFEPTTANFLVGDNQQKVSVIDRVYRLALLPVPVEPVTETEYTEDERWQDSLGREDGLIRMSATMVLAMFGILVAGVVAAWRWRRAGVSPARLTWVVLAGTVAFLGVVGFLFEINENNRFRTAIEPFQLVFVGLLVDRAVRWLRDRRRPSAKVEVPEEEPKVLAAVRAP